MISQVLISACNHHRLVTQSINKSSIANPPNSIVYSMTHATFNRLTIRYTNLTGPTVCMFMWGLFKPCMLTNPSVISGLHGACISGVYLID